MGGTRISISSSSLISRLRACFWAEPVSEDWVLKEHKAARWLTDEELDLIGWLPADVALVEKIREKQMEERKDKKVDKLI